MAEDKEGEDENRVCRICQDDDAVDNLISPCNCKGSLAYAHVACLERWLQQSVRRNCELCGYTFNSTRTLHYNLYRGLMTWFFKSNTPMGLEDTVYRKVCVDVFNLCLVTMIFHFLYYIFVLSADYFIISSTVLVTYWACVCLAVVTLILVLRYYYYMYSTISYHFELWFYWWQSNCTVRIITKPSMYLLSRSSTRLLTPRTTAANLVLVEPNLPGTVDLLSGNPSILEYGGLVPMEAVPHNVCLPVITTNNAVQLADSKESTRLAKTVHDIKIPVISQGAKDRLSDFFYAEETSLASSTASVRSTSTNGTRRSAESSDFDHINSDVAQFLQEVMCNVSMRLDNNMKASGETASGDRSSVPGFRKPSASEVTSARVATPQCDYLEEKRLTRRSRGSHSVSSTPDRTTRSRSTNLSSTSLSSEFTE